MFPDSNQTVPPVTPEPIPLNAPDAIRVLAPAGRQSRMPQRILVVEDDPSVRQLVSAVLTRSGYRVDTAEDGEAGWEMLLAASQSPDGYVLLITDNTMPKLSGIELIQKLRSARMTLPVILASGAVPPNTETLQLAAILPKPFTLDNLMKTVNAVLHPASIGRVDELKHAPGSPSQPE